MLDDNGLRAAAAAIHESVRPRILGQQNTPLVTQPAALSKIIHDLRATALSVLMPPVG